MINLRQMAEDEVIFRFESDADKREFWELFIKNSGDRYNNHISDLSNFAKLWECEDGKLYIDNYKYNLAHEYYPTWTEIKERYEMRDIHATIQVDVTTEKIMEAIESIKEFEREHNLHQAITLLEKNGYTITPPYVEPTDEEICERIKLENEKIGYVPDWSSTSEKYQVTLDTDRNTYRLASRIYTKDIGVVYTTKEIATQIVAELNEKRFERVSE